MFPSHPADGITLIADAMPDRGHKDRAGRNPVTVRPPVQISVLELEPGGYNTIFIFSDVGS